MNMRMQTEVFAPCMENTYGATFYPEMAVTKRAQCVPHDSKQMIVKPSAIQQANGIECIWNRENNMIMIDRLSIIHALFDPECLFGSLTLWTVTVATTIVTDLIPATMITLVLMAAKG